MRQRICVEMDDGATYEIDADARDIRAWEARYGISWFGARLTFTMLAQLAHLAGQRTGVLNGAYADYDAFDAHCVATRGRPAEVVTDPTPADRTDGSSAPLRSARTNSPQPSKTKARK